jgi:hypothetical protein
MKTYDELLDELHNVDDVLITALQDGGDEKGKFDALLIDVLQEKRVILREKITKLAQNEQAEAEKKTKKKK